MVNGETKPESLTWEEELNETKWIYLEGNTENSDFGYYFPSSATVKAKRETHTGSPSQVTFGGSEEVYSNNFVTMWLDHGANPSDAQYEYVLLPNKSQEEVEAYATKPDIDVLKHNNKVHAVRDNNLNLIGANFWVNEKITVDMISCDNKASVIVRSDGEYAYVSIADPTMQNTDVIHVDIDLEGEEVVSHDYQLLISLSDKIGIDFYPNGTYGQTKVAKIKLKNLGKAKGAIASSYEGIDIPAHVVDGDEGSQWTSSSLSEESITIDLERSYELSHINLKWGEDYAESFKVEVSEDGVLWTTQFESHEGHGMYQNIPLKMSKAHYVKLTCLSNQSEYYSVKELEVYGGRGVIDESGEEEEHNLSKEASVFVSSVNSSRYTGIKAIDGDMSTRWATPRDAESNQWITLDFGTPKIVNTVIIKEYQQRIQSFTLQYSDDGNVWSDCYTGSQVEAQPIKFPHIKARYLKLFIHEASIEPSIYEFEVYHQAEDNFALKRQTQTSSVNSSSYKGEKAVDGDESTRWATPRDSMTNQWLAVDLGFQRMVNGVKITDYQNRITSYSIQYSQDQSLWETAYTGNSISEEVIYFPNINARYMRLYIHQAAGDPSIYEFEVFYKGNPQSVLQ